MVDSIDRAARVLVVYYSATGHVHALAKAVAEGAEQVGADRVGRRDRVRNADEVRQRGSATEDVRRPGGATVGGGKADQQGDDRLYLRADRPRRPGVDDPGARQHLLPLGSDRAALGY